MSYTYDQFVTVLAERLGDYDVDDADFQTDLPAIINDAEQRCYRELDLISTVVTDTSATCTPNQRLFTFPTAQGRFVVVDQINIVFTDANNIVKFQPLVPVSREILDFAWPTDQAINNTIIPTMYAPVTDQTVLLGPSPGSNFSTQVRGTIRPTPLSAQNTTTFLTLYLSDLFLAAALVSASGGLLQNFGQISDNPQMALSWEAQYQKAFASADREEARRKYGSVSWTAKSPVMATPERG